MSRIQLQASTLLASLMLVLGISACRVGPQYTRPAVPAPPAFRGAEAEPRATDASKQAVSIGDEKWWEVFQDPQLQELIRSALKQNYDVRLAAERIVQAQAQVGVTRAAQFPEINANASITSQEFSKQNFGPRMINMGQLGLSASWNLDFWGQYSRATEQTRAQLLSQEWAHRAVLNTVVMNVATGYIQLRALDMQLEITKSTLDSRRQSLKLTQTLESGGQATMLDVRQAEQLVLTSEAQIRDLERQIEQQENSLCTLLGETPRPIVRGLTLDQQPHLPSVPAGIPSALLERRPDIRQAEETLIAANASIGVARAAYFPQISLTGSASTQSNALTRLFTNPASAWSYGPQVSLPIFNAGRIKSNVKVAESQQRQALLSYQQTIASSFRDVSNALVAYRKYQEYRTQQEKLAAAAKDAAHLSNIRYEGGQTAYLEVLTNETNYLSAELNLTSAKQNELLSLIQLYNALGGGWQQ